MEEFEYKNFNFKKSLLEIKDYIKRLIKLKLEKQKDNTKDIVDDIMTNKKENFLSIIKEKIGLNHSNKLDKYESHMEDRDEYIPHDMEFGENLWENSRFAEITPWFLGYFTSWKKTFFDSKTNLWSKRKSLSNLILSPDTTKKSYSYAWKFPAWIISIPLPEWSLPDINSLHFKWKYPPIFKIDQNNCLYIENKEKQYISFKFYVNQNIPNNWPISEDSEKIIFDKLTKDTINLLNSIKNLDSKTKALKIRDYIIQNKKYSTRLQWTLRDKSNQRNYISNLDKSAVLECFSANSLFVWLAREAWISSRLVVGHMIQSLDKDWKSLLSSNNWHAWSEIWDESEKKWMRIDATPTTKEDWTESWENLDQEKNLQNQSVDSNFDQNQNCPTWGKSPTEALDELIQKAKDDNLVNQAEKIKETIEKLEKAESKEKIRKILNESWLSDFAKEAIDEIWNEEILKQEIESLKNLDDEKKVDEALKNTLLDDKFMEKLKNYSNEIKKKIQENKRKMKSEMERLWFKEEEIRLYKLYKDLEKEIETEVKKQIRVLEKILPPSFKIVNDNQNYHKSWPKLWNTWKLIEYHLIWNTKIFTRNKEVKDTQEINMFETILIDRSGTMGKFEENNSPLREAVKAAIIRAKVLEYFKVNFSIIMFDTDIEEVMSFWEKFSDKRKNNIPARLMRAVMKGGWTDIWKPLTYTFDSMKKYAKKNWLKSFWNISFLWDWSPTDWMKWNTLNVLIDEIRQQNFWLTAYYINGSLQNVSWLQQYFGTEESWWTVVVWNVSELTEKLIWNYNTKLKQTLKRYTKKD